MICPAISKGKLSLVAGSSVAVTDGTLRLIANSFANTNNITLSSGTEVQFAENGGDKYAGNLTGSGDMRLVGGILQLTGTGNTYTGGTFVEAGSTLLLTTANVSTGNANIGASAGTVDFDQTTAGTYTGVISDAKEMGTGSLLPGTLIKDDSTGANSGNVTLSAVQAYTGFTYIEAGTLTLGAVDTLASSDGVVLGRVSGGATATLVLNNNNTLTALSDDASNTTSVQLNGHVLTLDPGIMSSSYFAGIISDGSGAGSIHQDRRRHGDVLGRQHVLGWGDHFGRHVRACQLAGCRDRQDHVRIGERHAQNRPRYESTNTIYGFAIGDVVDLSGLIYGSGGAATLGANNVLHIVVSTGTYDLKLDQNQSFAGDTFHLNQDNGTGTALTMDTVCFAPGTMIWTPDGEIAVEHLQRGDLVITTGGRAVAVSWLGRQAVSTRFGNPLRVLPIRIRCGALGENMPCRDLLVSPDHALLVDDVLIQAGALVNGISIVREHNVPEQLTYYHVEVDDHSLIFADNAAAETFIDNIDRLAFDNWAEHDALYPNGKSIIEMPYPRAKAHRQMPQATRARLLEAARALYGEDLSQAA